MMTNPQSSKSSHARLIIPMLSAGILFACGFVLLRSHPEQQTVSQVERGMREIARAGYASPDAPEAGAVGPWRIAAAEVDPVTGEFRDFQLESGRMLLSAERAQLHVDPQADTFSFEMWNVVFTRIPLPAPPPKVGDGASNGDPSFIHAMDHYVLGPAPWAIDIVPDATSIPQYKTPMSESPIASAGER